MVSYIIIYVSYKRQRILAVLCLQSLNGSKDLGDLGNDGMIELKLILQKEYWLRWRDSYGSEHKTIADSCEYAYGLSASIIGGKIQDNLTKN
jgi:hypothetical protein